MECMFLTTLFQQYRGGPCTYPCLPRIPVTTSWHNIAFKPINVTICHILFFSSQQVTERGINPVTVTMINPQKEISKTGYPTSDCLFSSTERLHVCSGGHIFSLIIMKLVQNVCLDKISHKYVGQKLGHYVKS